MIASLSGAMLNLVFIMALGRVYEKLAYTLTSWGRLSCEFFPSFKIFLGQGRCCSCQHKNNALKSIKHEQ
jgi:anoctamin-7